MRKKVLQKTDFYNIMDFELSDALEEKTCPICFLVQKSEYKYMNTLFYEFVNDPGVRRRLRKSYGFCTKHAQLAKKMDNHLGVAIIYQDICSTIIEKMEEEKEIPSLGERCSLCELADEVEKDYLQIFIENFSHKNFQDHYRQSFGLCMHHFLVVYSRLSGQGEKDTFKQYQMDSLRKYSSELEEFIRKHDYRFSNEKFGQEATSWRKVVDKLAGKLLSTRVNVIPSS